MSSSLTYSKNFTVEQITIYAGTIILIAGLFGGLCNTIVFLSLQTFRQNSCAFYLTVMSIVNLGQLSTGLLTRIMISGFDIDWTMSSIFYCKFRPFCYQACVLLSLTCMCLATIDQFLATCSARRWQQWSDIRIAHRLTIGFAFVWLCHGIPHWFYYNSVGIDRGQCTITSRIFNIYLIGIQTIVFAGFLPMVINTIFGLLAYRNVQNLTFRTIPLVRRELDKQLTVIVLIQAVYNCLSTMPYVIVNILMLKMIVTNNATGYDDLKYANILTLCLFYLNFASPFYMYMCVSERFRRQFLHVFYEIHFKHCQRHATVINQVAPSMA